MMKLKENVVMDLRNSIVNGEYKPGTHLREAELCRRYNMSRTPIREALQELEKEDLIKMRKNIGAIVTELTLKDVSDIYNVLVALEGAACRLACPQLTTDQIRRLEGFQLMMEKAAVNDELALFFEVNLQFHWLITEATKNIYLIKVRGNFRRLLDFFTHVSPYISGQVNASLQEHRKIIGAIKNSNFTLAEFLVREHFENARERMSEFFRDKDFANKDELRTTKKGLRKYLSQKQMNSKV